MNGGASDQPARRGAADADRRTARRRRARRLFKPLDRSYWPDHERRPYLRLILALLTAPLPTAALAAALAWSVYDRTEREPEIAAALALETGRQLAIGLYAIAFVGGALAIPYLWSTRRRSFWPWAFCGAFAGGGAAWIGAMASGQSITLVPVAVLAALGAMVFGTMRWIAGVRSNWR